MNKDSFSIQGLFIFAKHHHGMIAHGEISPLTFRAFVRRNIWPRDHSFPMSLIAALIMIGNLWLTRAEAPKAGDVFPELRSFGMEGSLPETKGKVLLVDFFASWCAPCQKSFPVMEKLHQEYAGKGLVIVAISVDQKKADLDRFLKKHSSSFSILRDASGKLAGELKLPTMPTSFLVRKDGTIASIHNGFHGEETRKRYVSEIEELLK